MPKPPTLLQKIISFIKAKKNWFIGIAAILVVAIGTALWAMSNPQLPAQVADNVLRPIFGEKNTLAIESVYFNISEQIKKIEYTFFPPKTEVFDENTDAKTSNTQNDDGLDLKTIPVANGLRPLAGEGVWKVIPQQIFPNEIIMAKTFVRPDSARPYANVALVQFDMKKLMMNIEAGTRYPGKELGNPGPGLVPENVQQSNTLLAVFNGGFQYRDGQYGMVVGPKTYVPLRKGLGTLFMYKNGDLKLSEYQGEAISPNVISIRQNGPLLVKDGQITSFVEAGRDTWGRTTTNSMYTWRSGLGITKEGHLVYAVGGSLVPKTLAQALLSAGAVNAMQLDINPFWVRFILFTPLGDGNYKYAPLLKNMTNGGNAYLHGYEKDFFYIYRK